MPIEAAASLSTSQIRNSPAAALIRLRKERFRGEIGRLQESSALSTAAC